MRNKVLAALRSLLPPGSHVVCALSGGADSVVMTHALHTLQKELGITLSACHFNHKLRGDAADEDESFCRELCKNWGIDLTVGSGDVFSRMEATGESLEEAARICRYEFFAEQSGIIATAHTADDRAETVLMNLLRGTGLKGLCGIPAKRDNFIRPLLDVSREEILAYLEEHRLPHREDESNHADDCLRNRLRHHVIPLLKKENPALLSAMGRMCASLQQDEQFLQTRADALLQGSLEEGFALQPLRDADESLRRRALRALLSLCRIPKLSGSHILAAENLVLGNDPSAEVHLPNAYVLRREYERLILEPAEELQSFTPVTLPCPGKVRVEELGITLLCTEENPRPITVRPRRQGDEICLPGGKKSVKKLLIDRKIPAKKRQLIPVLERDGEILALWGITDTKNIGVSQIMDTEEKES